MIPEKEGVRTIIEKAFGWLKDWKNEEGKSNADLIFERGRVSHTEGSERYILTKQIKGRGYGKEDTSVTVMMRVQIDVLEG